MGDTPPFASPRGLKPAARDKFAGPRGLNPAGGEEFACPRGHRRRGSVLVLVMTLLGVLFVTGIAFLATMNFEADMIADRRHRDRNRVSTRAIIDEFDATLRAGLMAGPDVPFGGNRVGTAAAGFAELPGVQNLFAPIEPYEELDPMTGVPTGRFLFRWFTDVRSLRQGPYDGSWWRALGEYQIGGFPIDGIVAASRVPAQTWRSGIPLTALPINPAETPLGPTVDVYPVDADGDGICDTLAFPMISPAATPDLGLGFSRAQVAGMVKQLNAPSNSTGGVYLGLRIIAHGGMVNLNESHPDLIANVFDLGVDMLTNSDNGPDEGYFKHRPSLQDPQEHTFYTPGLEEPLLRRRGLLPPREIAPSLLHGNTLLDPETNPFGEADMWQQLFPPDPSDPTGFQTVYKGRHTYTPFTPDDWDAALGAPAWALRMEPFTAQADPNGDVYDRRHLVTTVSHDDLLSRGGTWMDTTVTPPRNRDLVEKMRELNQAVVPGLPCPNPLPFEYPDYPQDMPNKTRPNINGDVCDAANACRDYCEFDARKGRLLLSLAWLDEMIERGWDKRLRDRLIHDVFYMLLRNAHGRNWDIPAADREELLSRTAASLTANILDYMDADLECVGGSANGYACLDDSSCPGGGRCVPARECRGGPNHGARCIDDSDCRNGICFSLANPTRIALRSFDFDDTTCVDRTTGVSTGTGCTTAAGCSAGQDCLPTAGWEFGSRRLPTVPRQYVYGLERQPFITEVATESAAPGGAGTEQVIARGVELFNPYAQTLDWDGDGDGTADYWLIEDDPAAPGAFQNFIPLDQPFASGAFAAYVDGNFRSRAGPAPAGTIYRARGGGFEFENGWIIYLARPVFYEVGASPTWIVVDQMAVEGINIGRANPPGGLGVHSLQRVISGPSSQWTAPVPVVVENPGDTLGNWNAPVNPNVRPVEVNFANTGRFTRLHPLDADDDPTNDVGLGVAFPTTGSLLLLMRHANRSLDEYSPDTKDELAFTTWLDGEADQIDNGRMPVFDVAGDHHVDPATTPLNTPGGLENLPWGQLVFDYFTSLPLRSVGPYENPNRNDITWVPGAADSIPRVDLEGLRVYGRINLNAAPWKVLAGLPLIPPDRLPEPFRGTMTTFAQSGPLCVGGRNDGAPCDVDDGAACPGGVCAAVPIGENLAQGIVAYRELREVVPNPPPAGVCVGGPPCTGDYGLPGTGRNWDGDPVFRRGTGFLSVGELANVRHPMAYAEGMGTYGWYSYYRMDGGMIGGAAADDEDYVSAIALLASLGDWVTVRSQVFTVYGTLRGELDPEILGPTPTPDDYRNAAADVDSRAIRFQETVDRLPTFLGEPAPVRIGERVIRKYTDAAND